MGAQEEADACLSSPHIEATLRNQRRMLPHPYPADNARLADANAPPVRTDRAAR